MELGYTTNLVSNAFGVGVTGQVDYKYTDDLNFTFTTGYISYANISAGIIPLKVGVKYFLNRGFYAAGQAGVGIISGGGGTSLAYSGMIGQEFTTKSHKSLDVGFKYDGYAANAGSTGSIGVRIGYKF